MRYYVVWPDGQKFGPADVKRLNDWVAEWRVGAATVLEEEATGRTLSATQVPGLNLDPNSQRPSPASRPFPANPLYFAYADDGSREIGTAQTLLTIGAFTWICLLLCFPLALGLLALPIVAMVYASKARRKGHPSADGVQRLAIALLVFQVILGAAAVALII